MRKINNLLLIAVVACLLMSCEKDSATNFEYQSYFNVMVYGEGNRYDGDSRFEQELDTLQDVVDEYITVNCQYRYYGDAGYGERGKTYRFGLSRSLNFNRIDRYALELPAGSEVFGGHTLTDFINYSVSKDPSQYNVLIIFQDEGLPVLERARQMKEIADDIVQSDIREMDYIFLYTGQMGQLEVLSELGDATPYIAASSHNVVTTKGTVARFVECLSRTSDFEKASREYLSNFAATYEWRLQGADGDWHVWRANGINGVDGIDRAVKNFCGRLKAVKADHRADVLAAMDECYRNTVDNADICDIANAVARRIDDAELRAGAADVTSAVSRALVAHLDLPENKVRTQLFNARYSAGVYLPSSADDGKPLPEGYGQTTFDWLTEWSQWLEL